MIFAWFILKLKTFVLLFVNVFRKAFCCLRKRRNSYSDTEPLTQVISNENASNNDAPTWSEWSDDAFKDNKPKTIQDYIEQYREQTMKLRNEKLEEDAQRQQEDFFDDMAPQITRQTKILIRNKNDESSTSSISDRLNVTEDVVNVTSGELREWDEDSGWEGERLLDHEAQRVLREQKRLERERKALEQHQKRLEKASRTLGSKLTA